MRVESSDWLAGLREFAAAQRLGKPPLEAGDRQASAQEAERAVLAMHLATWLDADLPSMLDARRRFAARSPDIDPDPALVLTTSPAGIAAAEKVLSGRDPLRIPGRQAIVVVREAEYRLWSIRRPDADHRLHVNHWSWLKVDVPRQRWGEFARFPVGTDEAYWLHRIGISGAGDADMRGCHLWKWTGTAPVLLQPFFVESVNAL